MNPEKGLIMLVEQAQTTTSLQAGYSATQRVLDRLPEHFSVSGIGSALNAEFGQGVQSQFDSNPAFAMGALVAAFEAQGRISEEGDSNV